MSKQISKIYHAAIYVRLSKEDGDVSTSAKAESNSISNQKDFIRNFLADKKDIRIVKEYVDDGYSGSNFDRPSFQTMMEDIKRGVIDCVVVKDLSRFGREYIDSGRYIERLFPALGVRFIAINDNYDSVTGKSQGDEIIIPFKNLINDAYCRDISIKIRSHLDVKRKNGEYIGAFVPYGYEKSDDDKHKLVIDIYAAGIVKEIFRLKLHGMSQDAIATQLNNEGVLAPMEYKQSTGSGYQTGFLQNEKSVWSSVTVRRILENEIYIGNLVQGKRTTPNHKVKQEVVKPESDWIRIEKNHEPIISDRDFEIVQRLLGMDTRISPDSDMVYNLSGIAVCADCGSPMTRKITTAGDKKYAYYICSNHKLTKQCSQHSISVSLLEDTVLEMLKLHIKNVMNLEEILDYIGTIPFQQLDVKSLEARKQKKLEEVEKCKRLKTSLYEDMKDGILTNYDGSTGGMNIAFKNLIYMLYSRDLSNKICSAKHTRILKGENISGQLRYGYVKDPNDKHKIIVDPEAAEVVKLIFELTAQGKRKTEVANYLNAHGIDTPSAYKKRKGSKNFFHAVEVKSLWSTSSIHDILNDEVYLGKLIWNKTKKRVGSNNTSTYVPKDEWIVIENCHEPIITQKLFDTAHANSKKYIRPKRGKRNYNPFYYCGVCGRALVPSKRVKGDILLCSSSRIEENSPCKSNRVEIAKVEDTIMKIVNMYATAYLDEKGIKKAGKSKEVSPEEKIATLEKKVKSLSSKKMMLYSDYKDDKLSREEYVKRSKAMVEQIDELHQEIEQLKTEIPPEDNSSSKFETQLESIINMESFDREKIQKIIKKVVINGEDNIEIVWNTDDPFFK